MRCSQAFPVFHPFRGLAHKQQVASFPHIHTRIISDDGHWASTRLFCVVQLISMTDSRTERLYVLLTASNSRHHITHMYLIQPVDGFFGLLKE